MKKYSFSDFGINEELFLSNEDNGFCVGSVFVVDNRKVKRQGKPAIKVRDAFNRQGYVKTKYLHKL